MTKILFTTLMSLGLFAPIVGCADNPKSSQPIQQKTQINEHIGANIKINVILGEQNHTASLTDNPTSRDLYAQLPLTLKVEDYANSEKIATPPKKLTTDQAPDHYQGKPSDITYYAPWGNLALFYHDGPNAPGLIYLGQFDQTFNPDHQATTITLQKADK